MSLWSLLIVGKEYTLIFTDMTAAKIVSGAGYRERNSTADRALAILMMYDDGRLTVSAAEVSSRLNVAPSTAYRYLQSLIQSGFVEESYAGGYRLGWRVLDLARLARKGFGLSEIARPVMRQLAATVGEAVLLTRLAGAAVVCLEREGGGSHPVRISYERGEVLPTNAGAAALALLAWLPEPRLAEILSGVTLPRFTPATLTSVRAVNRRLAETRAAGYAVSRGELDVDVTGVAAPVRGPDDEVVCAISVAALSARVPHSRVPVVADAVCAAAEEITSVLLLLG
jgi:DNA-binding IclR family transcriptional regulator